MSSVAQRLLTAQEFWELPGDGKHTELVRGEVVRTLPSGGLKGQIVGRAAMLLRLWSKHSASGVAAVKSGYVLGHNPDTVRGADISYVRADRIPASGLPEGFWPGAPDLAVEVVSPSETANDIQEKVSDFLQAGTPLVWVIYPRRGEVVVYTADGLARAYNGDDALEQADVLPGFSCKVSELFE